MDRHPLITTLEEINRECDKYYYKIYILEKINYKYKYKKNNFEINIL